MLAEGSPRGKDGLVFLSSSQYIATSGVQKCPICPFPRPTDPTVPAWFRPTPSIARRSLPATDKRRPHFYSRRVLSRRGRLKIRVLYYLAAFVRAWLGVRAAIGKYRTVVFSARYSEKVNARHQDWLNAPVRNVYTLVIPFFLFLSLSSFNSVIVSKLFSLEKRSAMKRQFNSIFTYKLFHLIITNTYLRFKSWKQ